MRTSDYISIDGIRNSDELLSKPCDPSINLCSAIVSIRARMLASLLRLKDALVDGCLVLDGPAHPRFPPKKRGVLADFFKGFQKNALC
jgi:hypothetical protein